MKKIVTYLMIIALLSVMAGCGSNNLTENPSTQASPNASNIDQSVGGLKASDDGCFVWDDNVITGLTEKGSVEQSLVIPENAEEVADNAFSRAENLEEIAFLNADTILGKGIFASCPKLRDVILPANLKTIPFKAFQLCEALETMNIPDSVAMIEETAFFGCSLLVSVQFGASVQIIGKSAFEYCTALTSVDLPDNLTEIGNEAFRDCANLESINFNNALRVIGKSAFYSCSSLTNLEFPNSLTTLGESAFSRCSNLESVVIPESATTFEANCLATNGNVQLKVKEGSVADIELVARWDELTADWGTIVYD
jgi:hypothetical protein